MSERQPLPAPLRLALSTAAAFSPLAAMLVLGAGSAALWLDEITYFRLQSDVALRAAEIGRTGSKFAAYFSNFFVCDLQRTFQAVLAGLGVDSSTSPELFVRSLSLASYAATVVLILVRSRREIGGWGALAGALAFACAPVFLYYAFEARVYALASFLAVLLLERVANAAERGTFVSLLTVGLVAIFAAHVNLWLLCLFAALLARALLELVLRRRFTPLVRALFAAGGPGVGIIVGEYAYMKATQPPEPLFPFFQRQPLGGTLAQTGLSIFEGPPQVQFVFQNPTARVFVVACLVLLGLLAIGALREAEREGSFGARSAAGTAVGALAISVALAVGFGYFAQGRYQVPLFAALFWATARSLTNRRRTLLAFLFVAGEVVLIPFTAAAIRAKSSTAEIAGAVLRESGSDASLIVQHGVPSGYPAPHHTIGLDFYLNDLRAGDPIPIFELPDLRSINGDHGTYRYFNGGEPLLARVLEIRPDLYRAWAARATRPDVWVVQTLWDVEPSRRQVDALLRVLVGEEGYTIVRRFVAPGYPRAIVLHLRKGPRA